jgi:hypothetical protein
LQIVFIGVNRAISAPSNNIHTCVYECCPENCQSFFHDREAGAPQGSHLSSQAHSHTNSNKNRSSIKESLKCWLERLPNVTHTRRRHFNILARHLICAPRVYKHDQKQHAHPHQHSLDRGTMRCAKTHFRSCVHKQTPRNGLAAQLNNARPERDREERETPEIYLAACFVGGGDKCVAAISLITNGANVFLPHAKGNITKHVFATAAWRDVIQFSLAHHSRHGDARHVAHHQQQPRRSSNIIYT